MLTWLIKLTQSWTLLKGDPFKCRQPCRFGRIEVHQNVFWWKLLIQRCVTTSVHGALLKEARKSPRGSHFLYFAGRSACLLPHEPHFGRIATTLPSLPQFQRYLPHLVAAAVAYSVLCLLIFTFWMYSMHFRVTTNSHPTSCCFLFLPPAFFLAYQALLAHNTEKAIYMQGNKGFTIWISQLCTLYRRACLAHFPLGVNQSLLSAVHYCNGKCPFMWSLIFIL